jgi:phosphoribosylformylglycinamidine synthase
VIDDITRRSRPGFANDGDPVYLLGETRDEFGGSEWHAIHGFLGGLPPSVDLAREQLLADVLINASRDGLLSSAHDLSEGGLAVALVESCLFGNVGARVVLPAGADPFVTLFSESTGRAVVSVPRSEEARFTELCSARGLPHHRVGVVDLLMPELDVQGHFKVSLRELRAAWSRPLPRRFER